MSESQPSTSAQSHEELLSRRAVATNIGEVTLANIEIKEGMTTARRLLKSENTTFVTAVIPFEKKWPQGRGGIMLHLDAYDESGEDFRMGFEAYFDRSEIGELTTALREERDTSESETDNPFRDGVNPISVKAKINDGDVTYEGYREQTTVNPNQSPQVLVDNSPHSDDGVELTVRADSTVSKPKIIGSVCFTSLSIETVCASLEEAERSL